MATRSASGPSWRAVLSYVREGHTIIGIDEVGRGAWAGPVTAAAVILRPKLQISGLADSKMLSPAKRQKLDRVIRREAIGVGIGWVSAREVDQNGLSWAVTQSGLRALHALSVPNSPYLVVLDGRIDYLAGIHPSIALVKADASTTPVAAASIVAKVARDRYMCAIDKKFQGYGFARHKGYGTNTHREALIRGVSKVHRLSVKPVAHIIETR